jgi:hypothetical protein
VVVKDAAPKFSNKYKARTYIVQTYNKEVIIRQTKRKSIKLFTVHIVGMIYQVGKQLMLQLI